VDRILVAQDAGRFRPVLDSAHRGDHWSWRQNPFVGFRSYRGLLVLNVMLNNSHLKPDNNRAAPIIRRMHRKIERARPIAE
jgi:hypothetical protein